SDAVRVGGTVSITAFPTQDARGNLAIGFRFNSAGGAEFHSVTSNNQPSGDPKVFRHLAIILDGEIISAPSLNAVIDTNGIIESPGGFQKEYVDKIVQLLRSGALPATLKQTPA